MPSTVERPSDVNPIPGSHVEGTTHGAPVNIAPNFANAMVKFAMGLLVIGMLISFAADLRILWYLWQGTGQLPSMTTLHWIAQILWAVGAVLLILPPALSRPVGWMFVVLQGALFVSCFFPAFPLTFWQEFVGRTLLSVAAAATLAALWVVSWDTVYKMFFPWYWVSVFRGKYGAATASVIGSEFLGWGYALYGLSPLGATALICVGSVFLVRMSQLGIKEGQWGAKDWLWLNWFYFAGGLAKITIIGISHLL